MRAQDKAHWYSNLVGDILMDARVIARTDKSLRHATYEAFCRVMWPNDDDLKDWNVTREEYNEAMRDAYGLFREGLRPEIGEDITPRDGDD